MMRFKLPLVAPVLVCCLLASCAGPRTTVIVVPSSEDGHVGAVRITGGGGEMLLDQPYLAVSTNGASPPTGESMVKEAVIARFASTLAARPEAPKSFTLYFKLASDVLTEESEHYLPEVIAELSRRPGADIVLTGHTDRVGLLADNDALSRKRAQTMANIIEALGIPAALVQAVGRGEREPLLPTADEVAEPRNRRVEVTVR